MIELPKRIPRATYRLQFTPEFTLEDGRELVSYLKLLGISELYSSPLFQASVNSSHGYDVNDYNCVSRALGGNDALDRLSAELRHADLGLILDFVPNHMGIDGEFNQWWSHVLENGARSKYAAFFDVEWHPRLERLNDRVLVPMLGDRYGTELQAAKIKLVFDVGRFLITYGRLKMPLRPGTYGFILLRIDNLLPSGDERKKQMREWAESFENLSGDDLESRDAELQKLKHGLAETFEHDPLLTNLLNQVIVQVNGSPNDPFSFGELHELLENQHFRLAHWKVGAHEVNYRRFFAIDSLIGLKMESPEVFSASHQLLGELIASQKVTGIRLDHIDGLWNPKQYLERLARLVEHKLPDKAPIYTLVEKILAPDESLPDSWMVHGTSGYEFAASLIELFLDQGNSAAWTRIYEDFTGERGSSRDLTYEDKIFILEEMFPNAVSNLARELDSLIEPDWMWRDLSLHDLQTGLRHLLACLPIYRTYRMPGENMVERESKWIAQAVAEGIRRNPCVDPVPIRFLGRVIQGDYPPDVLDQQRNGIERWVCKLQQVTGAIMAKSVEDTHFFRYVRMLGANEVGSHPSRFGQPVEKFHEVNAQRQQQMPLCLLTTSTHDTKMSEDARARLFALAELPQEWKNRLLHWHEINGHARTKIDERYAPDAREEYALYQMLLAAWPLETETPDEFFRSRMKAYFRKAQGEAKINTAWTYPHERWHAAGDKFIDSILSSSTFLKEFVPFAKRIAYRGMIFSLSQTVLRLTAPGVPDLYQGNEVWDFSMVDPDNRRPVDFARRRALLESLKSRKSEELLQQWVDGGIKMKIITALLQCRREFPELFSHGEYIPLFPQGERAEHIVSFSRRYLGRELVVVAARLIGDQAGQPALVWRDVIIPDVKSRTWKNLLTGQQVSSKANHLAVASAFSDWPVAVLLSE